jgi:hypothetical protein
MTQKTGKTAEGLRPFETPTMEAWGAQKKKLIFNFKHSFGL